MRISVAVFGVALAVCASAAPAYANDYVLSGTARVGNVTVIDNGNFSYDPPGLISYGDQISFSLRFTTDFAQNMPPFDADPTVHIYDLGRPISFSLTMGGYTFTTPVGRRPLDLSAQLWNDRPVVTGQPTEDAESFNVFDYTVGGRKDVLPFAMPAGDISEGVNFNNFGPNTLRSTDLISELVPLDGFIHSFSYIVQNASANYSVIVDGRNITMQLDVVGVPEPATWTLMLAGFGFVGWTARRRSHVRLSYS